MSNTFYTSADTIPLLDYTKCVESYLVSELHTNSKETYYTFPPLTTVEAYLI